MSADFIESLLLRVFVQRKDDGRKIGNEFGWGCQRQYQIALLLWNAKNIRSQDSILMPKTSPRGASFSTSFE
jgi:hypothetical protein